jgi:hypothetical protein
MEQQQHRPQLREDGEGLIGHEARGIGPAEEHRASQGDAYEQLSQNGWLAEALQNVAGELGGHQHEGQHEQDGRHGARVVARPGGGQRQ